MKYTISIHPEDLKGRTVYVGIVEENNVSSFGFTPEEALDMTLEALQGVLESEAAMAEKRRLEKMLTSLTQVSENQYSLSFPAYATDFQIQRNRKDREKTLMAA